VAGPERSPDVRPSIPAEPAARAPGPAPTGPEGADLRDHLPALRVALLQQRRFRVEQLEDLRAAAPADGAQEEVAATLELGARVALAGIEAALARMDRGAFGRCTRCDAAIPLERLEILPAVATCTTCLPAGPPAG
jgi:DnaK suppressor protein